MTAHLTQHDDVSHCHNCGAAVQYHYCSVCGQETRLHVASAGEFIHEFVGHYVALEGKLVQTLRFLMLRPGFLTAEYIAGRRKRYVEPLRVYLTLSLLFFAVLKLGGPPLVELDGPAAKPAVAQVSPGPALSVSDSSQTMNDAVLYAPPQVQKKVIAFLRLPDAEKIRVVHAAFFKYVPYAMFLLMPLFALYLKMLYLGGGRRYGEHLLFALHSNAFAFAMFSVLILVGYVKIGLLSFACAMWLFAWLPMAMQRVYGGSRWLTFLRWQALSLLHILSIGAAVVASLGFAVAL